MNILYKKRNQIYTACIVLVILMILKSFLSCHTADFLQLQPTDLMSVCTNLVGLILCGILILSLADDKPRDKQNRALFRLLFTLCALLHCNVSVFMLERHTDALFGLTVYSNILLFTEMLLIFTFWIYVCTELGIDRRRIPFLNWLCRGTLLAGLLLTILNMKYHFIYVIDANGVFMYGRYVDLGEIPGFILYASVWYVVLKNKERSVGEKATLLSFQILPFIAHILSVAMDAYEIVFPSYLFSIMLIYINVFAVRSKKMLEQEVKLDRQKTALMISQIQPHFLYNVLTTISNLCMTDPDEAEETTVLFAQYLRTNIDSLQQSKPVPFRVELEHIRTYIELEKKRFGNKINVEINCLETDFPVPVLGLQPIAENSIKHGIRGKGTPGHLRISSRKVQNGYEVVIEDDGVGFDMHAPLPDDGRKHVGLSNVKTRLERMCNATVTVLSSPGNGCRTTIFFPEKGK